MKIGIAADVQSEELKAYLHDMMKQDRPMIDLGVHQKLQDAILAVKKALVDRTVN